MRRHRNYIGILAAAITMPVCLVSCSDELDPKGNTSASVKGNVYVQLNVALTGNGIPQTRSTRATATPTDSTPGTTAENKINTIDLLVYEANGGKLTSIIPFNPADLTKPVKVEINDVSTPKHIYAAINLPASLRTKLVNTTEAVEFHSTLTNYWDVINEFVPGSNGKVSELSETTGIPMTGLAFNADGKNELDFYNVPSSATNPITLKVNASRLVAKMHVLATVDNSVGEAEADVDYVKTEAKTEGTTGNTETGWDQLGWIRLANVKYLPNGTNKHTYLIPQSNTDGNLSSWKDPNMDLNAYASVTNNVLNFNEDTSKQDFTFYTALEQHEENVADNSHFSTAEKFDDKTLTNTLANKDVAPRYTNGMYCLENYFDTPISNANLFANYDGAIPTVTQVAIAAKLVPKWLVISQDYEKDMEEFIRVYQSDKNQFKEDYDMTEEEFNQTDIDNWEIIKKDYKTYLEDTQYKWSNFRIVKMKNEADALNLINWALKFKKMWSKDNSAFQSGKFPDGTFYSYDRKYSEGNSTHENKWQQYLYLTMDAVIEAGTDVNFKTYAVQHVGGWGYYYTYLDETNKTTSGKTPYTASQVTRNTYYLVHITKFTGPGGTITRPEYIKVNTQAVGWDYAGRGDIELH